MMDTWYEQVVSYQYWWCTDCIIPVLMMCRLYHTSTYDVQALSYQYWQCAGFISPVWSQWSLISQVLTRFRLFHTSIDDAQTVTYQYWWCTGCISWLNETGSICTPTYMLSSPSFDIGGLGIIEWPTLNVQTCIDIFIIVAGWDGWIIK